MGTFGLIKFLGEEAFAAPKIGQNSKPIELPELTPFGSPDSYPKHPFGSGAREPLPAVKGPLGSADYHSRKGLPIRLGHGHNRPFK